MKNSYNNDIELKEYLKEYTITQYNTDIANINKYIQSTEETINKALAYLENYIMYTAKMYNQKVKEKNMTNLKTEFNNNIQEYINCFMENIKKLLYIKQILQKSIIILEIDYYNKKMGKNIEEEENIKDKQELIKLAKECNLDALELKIQQIRRQNHNVDNQKELILRNINKRKEIILQEIAKCQKNIEEINNDMQSALKFEKLLTNDRFHNINDKYLVVVKPKNSLKKITDWFNNIINGKTRYTKEIIENLQKGIINIKEYKIADLNKKCNKNILEYLNYIENRILNKNTIKEEIIHYNNQQLDLIMEETQKQKMEIINKKLNNIYQMPTKVKNIDLYKKKIIND